MPDEFHYDVFLSHSSKDKAIVRDVAERLRKDGVKVWFDEWEIRPGDSIPAKIEEGLERSRVLVLCMSANAFGSEWAQLESGTFRFRDPLNKERRFIPLRLDDSPIKGSLAQFLCITWFPAASEQEYFQLLEACQADAHSGSDPSGRDDSPSDVTPAGRILSAHYDAIYSIAATPDGKWVIADYVKTRLHLIRFKSEDEAIFQSEIQRKAATAPLVRAIKITPDGQFVVTCASDPIVEIWSFPKIEKVRVLKGLGRQATCVDVSPDGMKIVAGSYDGVIHIWDFGSGKKYARLG